LLRRPRLTQGCSAEKEEEEEDFQYYKTYAIIFLV
jgi:hypothetical protein